MIFTDYLDTPIGTIEVKASLQALESVIFVEAKGSANANEITALTCQQLAEYFQGERHEFDLPLGLNGTEFQQSVWHELQQIAYAQTCSYKDVAMRVNNPKGVRAVGSANGKNPIAIVVPCHRVIANNGSLSGYAFGVDKKAWLLRHEKKNKAV